jgi:hypothetical protein
MTDHLPNLDFVDDLERGQVPPPEPTKPSDTQTQARCLLSLPCGLSKVLPTGGTPNGFPPLSLTCLTYTHNDTTT